MRTRLKNNVIASIVAILMLLAAMLLDLPYDYYVILRWVICGIAIYLAYNANLANKKNWVWIMGIIALIFNPIFKVYLSRGTWSYIDIIAIGLFGASIYYLRNKEKNK